MSEFEPVLSTILRLRVAIVLPLGNANAVLSAIDNGTALLFSQLNLLHRLGVRAHLGTRRPLPMLFQIDIMRLLQPGSQEKLGRPMWTPQELQNLVEYDK